MIVRKLRTMKNRTLFKREILIIKRFEILIKFNYYIKSGTLT